uniref:Uncharacterized protein n=1 Tax=Anguilla anguilla TaxID=7936 RepID=A0A0E9VHI1_ANGAN
MQVEQGSIFNELAVQSYSVIYEPVSHSNDST